MANLLGIKIDPNISRDEARKLWMDALLSGTYSQTTETLHDKTGWCCLGVA